MMVQIKLSSDDIIKLIADRFQVADEDVTIQILENNEGGQVHAIVDTHNDPTVLSNSEPAMMIEEWGNHDGRFNIKCRCCGYRSHDIPASSKPIIRDQISNMVCPSCGKSRYTKHE